MNYRNSFLAIVAALVCAAMLFTPAAFAQDTTADAAAYVAPVTSDSQADAWNEIVSNLQNYVEGDTNTISPSFANEIVTAIQTNPEIFTNVSPELQQALENINNLSDTNNFTPELAQELISTLENSNALEQHQSANNEGNHQNQAVEFKYPRPKPVIPGSHAYPIVPAASWPEGDVTPQIFRKAPGIVPGLWIIPEMIEGMKVVPVNDRSNPTTFVVEENKRNLYTRIIEKMKAMESWAPEADLVIISTELVDMENEGQANGAGLSVGHANPSGWGFNLQAGHNRSTARENRAYRVVLLFLEDLDKPEPKPEPVVETVPAPAPTSAPVFNVPDSQFQDWLREAEAARQDIRQNDEARNRARRDSGIPPCDNSPASERGCPKCD